MNYADERFADVQLLRYRLEGFEQLQPVKKILIYYLAKAALAGRDITFDQKGRYNLRIRKLLETVYTDMTVDRDAEDWQQLVVYLKRVWFSNGIYHHYGGDKLLPAFDPDYLRQMVARVDCRRLPLKEGETLQAMVDELWPVIFDPEVLPRGVNRAEGQDIVATSACNFYEGVTQREAVEFYEKMKREAAADKEPLSYGLNSTLVKDKDGRLKEVVWKADGRYANAISHIVYWLRRAATVAENERQKRVIGLLVDYYVTGDLRLFNEYCKEWVAEQEGRIDFVNGFIEVYGDPLGLKGSWEGIVEYRDVEATRRTQTISSNAQWFEDHSPVDPRFRKPKVKGVTASAVCVAMLGGDEYPSTAIGINLPNADWIRAEHGSKSVTISNIVDAYNRAAHGNGLREEFVIDRDVMEQMERYGDVCDTLHTDLHECLGHGSGRLLAGTDPDALREYGNAIEEARADLFALYFMADAKLVELGLLPDGEAYRASYYSYMMNGLMTQLVRIRRGQQIEEAHMRNRALIARWCLEQGRGIVEMVQRDGKTYVSIADYQGLRGLFAQLLAEVQRIKSEGDYEAARRLVEGYGVKVDDGLHREVLQRYELLNLAPYKGFINPRMLPIAGPDGQIADIGIDYSEPYAHQMLRYSSEYGTLI
ncbi:MAG: dihydrofolate reductase [Prevotella sp.]|nr:dihydrofolate reductase [Prevotella sp.]